MSLDLFILKLDLCQEIDVKVCKSCHLPGKQTNFAAGNKQIKAEHFCQALRGMATRRLTLFPPAEVTAVNRNY